MPLFLFTFVTKKYSTRLYNVSLLLMSTTDFHLKYINILNCVQRFKIIKSAHTNCLLQTEIYLSILADDGHPIIINILTCHIIFSVQCNFRF